MKICSIKCPLCSKWMATLKTAKGRPWLYCGKCRYGFMLMANVGIQNFEKAAQEISESDLIPETRKKYQELKYGEQTEE